MTITSLQNEPVCGKTNHLANQIQISCGVSLGRGNQSYINGPGHMTKTAARAINSINL